MELDAGSIEVCIFHMLIVTITGIICI